jgi:DNA repair protein RecO
VEQRDLAIVLRVIPFEERHLIVHALTENHGQVTAIARNAVHSRRFGGALEPFTAAEWSYHEKPGTEFVSLREVNVKRAFEGIRSSFEKLTAASALNEMVLRVAAAKEGSPLLFRLHANALAALEELVEDDLLDLHLLRLLNADLAKILQWSGHQPQTAQCLDCGKAFLALNSDEMQSREFVVSFERAGWFCVECGVDRGGFKVPAMAFLDLASAMHFPLKQALGQMHAEKSAHQSLFQFLEGVVSYHVPGFDGRPFKSLKLLGLESNPQSASKNPPQNQLRPF